MVWSYGPNQPNGCLHVRAPSLQKLRSPKQKIRVQIYTLIFLLPHLPMRVTCEGYVELTYFTNLQDFCQFETSLAEY